MIGPDASRNPGPAIFLDKDGTLIRDLPYNVDVDRIQVYPEVPPVLARLAAAGYSLIVVSNQPGIAHGYFDEAAVTRVNEALCATFAEHGVAFKGFYYCPHHPAGRISRFAVSCDCRKPRPGLIERAAKEHYIDLKRSWMVGDILNDVEAGNRAGCRTILVDRGNETEWIDGEFRKPDHVTGDMRDLLLFINEPHHVGKRARSEPH